MPQQCPSSSLQALRRSRSPAPNPREPLVLTGIPPPRPQSPANLPQRVSSPPSASTPISRPDSPPPPYTPTDTSQLTETTSPTASVAANPQASSGDPPSHRPRCERNAPLIDSNLFDRIMELYEHLVHHHFYRPRRTPQPPHRPRQIPGLRVVRQEVRRNTGSRRVGGSSLTQSFLGDVYRDTERETNEELRRALEDEDWDNLLVDDARPDDVARDGHQSGGYQEFDRLDDDEDYQPRRPRLRGGELGILSTRDLSGQHDEGAEAEATDHLSDDGIVDNANGALLRALLDDRALRDDLISSVVYTR